MNYSSNENEVKVMIIDAYIKIKFMTISETKHPL